MSKSALAKNRADYAENRDIIARLCDFFQNNAETRNYATLFEFLGKLVIYAKNYASIIRQSLDRELVKSQPACSRSTYQK